MLDFSVLVTVYENYDFVRPDSTLVRNADVFRGLDDKVLSTAIINIYLKSYRHIAEFL